MKRRWWRSGVVCTLVVVVLAGCGGSSTPNPTATVVATATTVASVDNVEPTGEPAGTVAIATHVLEPLAPTSTLYAAGEPTPTVIAGAKCSYWNPNTLVFQSFEEQRAEAHACYSEFVWPAGYEIDPEKLAFEGSSTAGSGEVGIPRTAIAFNNMCAWMNAWLDATKSGDDGSADRALNYMLNIMPYTLSQDLSDPTIAFLEPAQKASLGDPSAFLEWVNGWNCSTYEIVRADP